MNNFLKECFKTKTITNICYILGNESCDLDSAVCAISLAYFYYYSKNKIFHKKTYNAFIPILNVSRSNFPIKSEVVYYFKQHEINSDNICFMDDIDERFLQSNDIVLVDHHFSPYRDSVIQVIDHHQFDSNCNLRNDCDTKIDLVGSCSSLIADLILKSHNPEEYKEVLKLLYGPIVLDTVNFSKEADKARQLDLDVSEKIEKIFSITSEHKQDIFESLVKARAAIDGLNAYQILFKDMKLVLNQAKTFKIAIPGYPILVQEYIKMDNAENYVKEFSESQNCSIIVLMGMKIVEGSVERDLGIININNRELFENIVNGIRNCKEPNLNVEEYENCKFLNGVFFRQNNVKASRKQILPLVKSIMEDHR
ncbi:exopolyphosphatase PRUNE1 [Condylostylus longicornis]|uniref:exopolyphosphatase PRUNE1 n=1 Tax=Condylostylus longicornis TaxID=2530218 RepID=UPI00244E26EB|nr:exopolyphosphatase PRUNE1 [Condylostylus longicornis]